MNDEWLSDSVIALNFAQVTHVGGRHSNQDSLGNAQRDELSCFVVSDGAGGHVGGEIASSVVVKAVLDRFTQNASFSVQTMTANIGHSIIEVAQRKAQEAQLKDMSATVAVVMIDQKNRFALWGHLGDTRIYLFHRSRIQSITRDHSVVQQFIDAGYCKQDQLRTHPQRSTLFAAIGAEGDALPAVTEQPVPLQDGDALLICTDGFWEWLNEDEMEQTLAMSTTVEEWLGSMSAIVEKNGSAAPKARDNYTACAIWLGQPESVTVIR